MRKKGTVHLEGLYVVDSLHRGLVRRAGFLKTRCVRLRVVFYLAPNAMKTGTNREITWGRGCGGRRYECCLYIRLYKEREKPNTKNERGNATTMTCTRRYRWASPFSGRLLKLILRQIGFSWLRILSDVRYTDSGELLPVSPLGCYAAATASSSQSIGSLFTFAADPRRRLMAPLCADCSGTSQRNSIPKQTMNLIFT